MGSVHLVVNPAAGRGAVGRRVAAIVRALEPAAPELHLPSSVDATRALLDDLVRGGSERVVVAGGDGLVHLAVAALRGTGVALGVVPVGSGNDFARALGLPSDLAAAARVALGPPTTIDVIEATPHVALEAAGTEAAATVATVGFSVSVDERGNALWFGPFGRFRYELATLLELPRLRPLPLRLRLDDAPPLEAEVTLAAVANTRFFGAGMDICPAADPTDGLLDVTVVGAVPRLELLRFFRLVYDGRHLDHPAVSTFRAATVGLEAADAPARADGEPFGRLPVRLRADAGALAVARP
jgi:diacylglycerol kinase (ATP)